MSLLHDWYANRKPNAKQAPNATRPFPCLQHAHHKTLPVAVDGELKISSRALTSYHVDQELIMRRVSLLDCALALTLFTFATMAARGAPEIGDDIKPLQYWLDQLKSTDSDRRFAAVRELETRTLLEAAKRKYPERPDARKLRPEEIPALVTALADALRDPDPLVRSELATALADLGPQAKAALPALIEQLKDENAPVRKVTAWALGEIGTDLSAVLPALERALADQDANVRWTAAYALGTIGPCAKSAIVALEKAAKDLQGSVQVAARLALWRLTGAAKIPGPAIGDAAEDSMTLLSAFTWLSNVGTTAVPILRQSLKHERERVRYLAAYALAETQPPPKEAVPDLIIALSDRDPMVRQFAAYALGQLKAEPAKAVPALIQAINDSDPDVRKAAADAFKILDPEAARKRGIK
jgi:HEAT repeat protein